MKFEERSEINYLNGTRVIFLHDPLTKGELRLLRVLITENNLRKNYFNLKGTYMFKTKEDRDYEMEHLRTKFPKVNLIERDNLSFEILQEEPKFENAVIFEDKDESGDSL